MTRQDEIEQRSRIAISRALLKNQAPYYTLNELKDIEKKCVAGEMYELAAVARDEIKKRKPDIYRLPF